MPAHEIQGSRVVLSEKGPVFPEYLERSENYPVLKAAVDVCWDFATANEQKGKYKGVIMLLGGIEAIKRLTNEQPLQEGDHGHLDDGKYPGVLSLYSPEFGSHLGELKDSGIAVDSSSARIVYEGLFPFQNRVNEGGLADVYEIRGIKHGARHGTAIEASENPGIDLSIAVSEEAGTVMVFREGRAIRSLCYQPLRLR